MPTIWGPPSFPWLLSFPWLASTAGTGFPELIRQPITVGSVLSRLKDKFEGGTSFGVNWYEILGEASDIMVEKINPRTLKRTLPLLGGIIQDTQVYLCPADVASFSGMYGLPDLTTANTQVANNQYRYVKPEEFNNPKNADRVDIFSDIYLNGLRLLVIKHDIASVYTTIDDYSAIGTKTGSLSLNGYNTFSGGSLDWALATGQSTVADTFGTPQDYTSYFETGDIMLQIYVPEDTVFSDLTINLYTTVADFFVLSSSVLGFSLTRGWNFVRMPLRTAIQTGSPNIASIVSYEIVATTTADTIVTLESLILKTNTLRFLEYFTKYVFRDGTTYAYKDVPTSDTDLVFLERNESNILLYEAADIVIQNGTYSDVESKETQRVMLRKAELYEIYNVNFGSTQLVASHSRMPVV